jgi:iron complex outermembrane receptor protein
MFKPFVFSIAALLLSLQELPAQHPVPFTVRGRVIDAQSGQPVAGATIVVYPANATVVTAVLSDRQGRYMFTLGSAGSITVTRSGYAASGRALTPADTVIEVSLSRLGQDATRTETAQSLEGLTIRAVRAGGEAPIAQTTMGRERLERDYSGQDVPLSLRSTPSVTAFAESGSLLNYSYFRIRGIDQSRINITLDGVPLNEPEDQQIYFSDFPDLTSSIQSVQIQRGVGTSTFGQAAFGGSVNFATPALSALGRDVSLTLGGGSFGTQRATLSGNSGPIGERLSLHGRVSGMRSDGYRDGATSAANSAFVSAGYLGQRDVVKFTATTGLERNGQTYSAIPLDELRVHPRANPLAGVGDKYRESAATLNWTRLISTATSAGLTAYGFGTRGFYDYPSGAPGPALRFRSASRWAGLIAAGHSGGDRWSIDGGAHVMSYSKDHEFDERADLQYPGYSNTGYKNEASGFAKMSLSSGSSTLFADLQVRTAQFRYRPTAGYGLDEVSQRWSFVNPKVGVTVRLSQGASLYASWGTTGREPTRADLFAGADDVTPDDAPALLPLTRVRPEHVNDLEAGATIAFGRGRVTANVFDMQFRDEIARTGATTPLGYDIRANVGSSFRRGIELDALLLVTPTIDFGAAVTMSHNRIEAFHDEATGVTYRDVAPILTPELIASHQATWRPNDRISVSLDGRYQSTSYLAPRGDEELTAPPFYVLDAGLRITMGRQDIHVQGRNLLDRFALPSGDVSSSGVPRYFILAPRSLDVSVTIRR